MTKIAFIGAGSLGFTAGLVRDILTFPLLRGVQIALMDIDPERLAFTKTKVTKIITEGQYPLRSRPPSIGWKRCATPMWC